MMTDTTRRFGALGALFVGSALAWSAAAAGQTVDLGSIDATGSSAGDPGSGLVGTAAPPGSAPAMAPTQGSLNAIEPTSIISDRYIKDVAPPSSDYSQTLKMAPSVVSTSVNGPGGNETVMTLRGFQDGQYNITMDGIPFGDTNDFTHHSTTYFPAGMLGQVVVDRGPGYASTMGYATFGGTVGLMSRPFSDTPGGEANFSYGSFNTWHYGGEAQSGLVKQTGTRILFDYDRNMTDGALQNGHSRQTSYTLKIEQPIGERFVATLFSSVDNSQFNNIAQITMAQAMRFGIDYAGLNNNPYSSNYAPFNQRRTNSDFEYISLVGDAEIFQIDNKIYTAQYTNKSNSVKSQTVETTPSLYTPAQLAANPGLANDVMGFLSKFRYRAWGDITTLSRDVAAGVASGTVRTGIWLEHEVSDRYRLQRDDTLGVAVPTATYPTAFQYNEHSTIDNVQPFLEYEWQPIRNLSITPGYKHVEFGRNQFAHPEPTVNTDISTSKTYRADLDFLTARYRVIPELSVYAQYARGFLAPNVNAFYVADPAANHLQPQSTINHQLGFVWKSDRLTVDGDAFFIDFNNYAQQVPLVGTNQTYWTNLGGVYYKGLEGEATVAIGHGFSLYGNATVESAQTKGSHLWVAQTPDVTAAAGLLYEQNDLFGSLLTKYIGQRYAGSGQVAGTTANRLKPYNTTDLVLGGHLRSLVSPSKDIKLTFGINNLLDHRSVADSNGALAPDGSLNVASATYYWLPPRSFFGAVSAVF